LSLSTQVYKMGTGSILLGSNPAMDQHPIQGGVAILSVASCCRNWYKPWPCQLPWLLCDFTLPSELGSKISLFVIYDIVLERSTILLPSWLTYNQKAMKKCAGVLFLQFTSGSRYFLWKLIWRANFHHYFVTVDESWPAHDHKIIPVTEMCASDAFTEAWDKVTTVIKNWKIFQPSSLYNPWNLWWVT